MSKHVLSGIAALLAPLGIYASSNHSLGSYQRSYLSARQNASMSVPESTQVTSEVAPIGRVADSSAVVEDDDELVLESGKLAKELVIIDQAVPDKEMFYAQARPGVDIIEIQANQDGMAQLKAALASYRDLDALHLLSHAEDGIVFLGNSKLTEDFLRNEITYLSVLDNALKDGADLFFYGCNLAKGNNGDQLLTLISGNANVDIAASNDLTGSSELGGDWDLEISKGDVTIKPMFESFAMQDFAHVLGYSGTLALGNMPTGYANKKSYTIPSTSYVFTVKSGGSGSKDLYNYSAGYVYVSTNDATHTTADIYFGNGETFDLTSLYVYQGFLAPTKTIRITSNKGGQQDSASTVAASSGTTINFSGANWQGITKFTIQYSDNTDMHWVKLDNIVLANVQSASPSITSATYDYSTGNLVVTGSNFDAKSGGANDVTVNLLTITGEGGGGSAYTLTSGTNIERDSATQFTIPISGTDKLRVDALLNKNLTTADDGTTYNLAAADDFIAQVTAGNTADATNAITVSNYANPTVTSATYDASTGALVVTGTAFSSINGANNDVVANTFTFTGDGGDTYTLTDTANVDVASATQFTLTLSATDKFNVNGILNKNGFNAASGQAYNLAAADNWMAGGAGNVNIADAAATINTSNVSIPGVTSAAYNRGTGVLTVTGTNFIAKVGATNDVDVTKLVLTGEGGITRTLTSSNVELTSATSFAVTLNAADRLIVNGLLNKDGTQAEDATNYNLSVNAGFLPATDPAARVIDSINAVTVSNTVAPTVTSATYNASSGALVVTATGMASKTGATNDIDVTKLSLLGEGGNSYTLTGSNVELTSETAFTVNLNATDKIYVNGLLNKDGSTSGDNTTYNLAAAEDWQGGIGASVTIADLTTNGVTVSSTQIPAISSATYDFATGVLAVTGTNMVKKPGVTNDVDLTKLTLRGLGSSTRTLTTTNVELTSETAFSVTLNSADKTAVNALLDNNGTQASDSVVYNINAAEDWMTGSAASANVVDATGNGITVSNVPVPAVTSATYNFSTGILTVTGSDFEAKAGAANDVTVNKITLTGQGGGSYTLTSGTNVEITNATSFSVTLSGSDKTSVNALLNKNGTQADDNQVYNIAVADDFIANVTAGNTADTTGNPVTASAVAAPTVTSATYNFSTGALVVTGTNFTSTSGANNDVDSTKLTLTGEAGGTYTLTSSSVDITSETSFTLTLNAADKLLINGLLNKDGTSADSGTTYNIAAADNWMAGAAPNTDIADLTNGITVSNVATPVIASATYNAGSGLLTVTGTNFTAKSGSNNDVDITKLTLTGEGGNTHVLTTGNVDVTNDTTFAVTLDAGDKIIVNGLLNKNGTQADDGATNYNLAAADNYMLGAATNNNITDSINGITVSNVQVPAITSATYNASTATLVVTGTNMAKKAGASNDIDVTKLALTGEGGNSYTLTSNSVELTSETAFTVALNTTDKLNVNGLLNKDGTTSGDNTTYNLAGAENWQAGAATSATIADLTTNGVTVSNTQIPTVTSATYDYASGVLSVTGTNMVKKPGVVNDVDVTKLTITGLGSGTRVLTTTNVEITNETSFSVTLNSADKTTVNALLDANGTKATDNVTYNLAAAEDWMTGSAAAANVVDATNGVTVSNVPVPTVTSATYHFTTGVLTVTGTDFEAKSGAANDVTVNKITLTGQGGSTYTLTSGTNVEITNATTFSVTLTGADKTNVNALLNKDGTQADDNTAYNIAVADDFIANVTAGNTADTTGNPVTVSAVAAPVIASATYDFATGALVVSGSNFTNVNGANNDVDPTKLTLTGDSGGTYTLTSAAVDITNETTFTITLNSADQLNVGGLLNKNGTTSGSGTTYNLAGADNWMAGGAPNTDIADLTNNGVTVSNVTAPALTSATYDFATGVLLVTGTNFIHEAGATNDVDPTKLTVTGDSGGTYTLTSSAVEITNGTSFSITVNNADKLALGGLLNKNGLVSGSGTTYNLAGADNWMPGADATANTADLTGNGITVSNVAVPTITTATYDASTGVLAVTGTNLVAEVGTGNDVLVAKFTLTGEAGGTHALTSSNVEITDGTSFSVTLNAADKVVINGLLNKDGTSSGDNTTYNLAAATRWLQGSDATVDSADATNTITVSNTAVPAIVSATYDASTGTLVVAGTGFVSKAGATNDVDVTKLTLTGNGSGTHTLTSSNVEVSSETSFSVTLNSADKLIVNGLLSKNGTQAPDNVVYNLAAAEDWLTGAAASATIADLAGNGVTVSNVANPTITSATYDASTGVLAVTGTDFVSTSGAANDVDATKLTITGDGAGTYTLTSSSVEITSATAFSITLNTADKNNVGGLLNKNGLTSDTGTTYNLAAADNWMAGADSTADIADLTGNGITVSNVTAPAITSALYNAGTGQLVLQGTNFVGEVGATNDIDPSKLTVTGEAGGTYTLTVSAVEITNSTQAVITLTGTDKLSVNGLLNKDGTAADDNTTYNIAAADNWMAGAAATTDIADLTGNGITVSGVSTPTITSASFDASTAVLVVTGTGFTSQSGAANDVDITKLSLTGQGNNSHTLTSSAVEITSDTAFSVTLNAADQLVINGLLNKNGTTSADNTTYNLTATDNWLAAAATSTDIADATNAVTVSNVQVPTIASATYDVSTGVLAVTASGLVSNNGANNDVDITKLTLTGQGGGTHSLTGTNVEVTSATAFSVTLNASDKLAVNGLLNKNGTQADDNTSYNLAAAEDWLTGADASATIADLTGNAVTVSNVAVPTITSATYDATTGVMAVTGVGFVGNAGANNDVDLTKLTVTGENGNTYTITNTTGVEINSDTAFSFTLSGADKTNVDGLLNKNGTVSDVSSSSYNLAAADNWMTGSANSTDIADLTGNGINVSNVTTPAIASATYDASTGVLTVTGTNFRNLAGSSNDVDISLLTITGDNGNTYTISATSDVEITSASQFTLTVSGSDKLHIDGLLNKNGATSDVSGTTYNLAAADNWMTGSALSSNIADLTGNGITVSNVTTPTITSATYDFSSGALVVTGANFRHKSGSNNDVDVTKLSLKGEGSNAYTLTGTSVEVSSATAFSLTLSETDKINVNGLLNKEGTAADDTTIYNLAAADNWMTASVAATDIADSTAAVTVSSYIGPSITSITYDYTTGVVTITGSNFVKQFGSANDIDISLFTFTGENGQTYTLTSAVDIEITSSSSFTITLTGADLAGVNALMTSNGTVASSGTTYNVAVADNWMPGAPSSSNTADGTTPMTVSNVPTPTITSSTYDAATGTLTVTGTNFVAKSGSLNDVSVSKLTLTGEGSSSYTLTSPDVEVTNGSTFSVVLNAVDKRTVNGLLNRDGTSSDDSTTYNLAAADDFIAQTTAGDSSDTTATVTVSNVTAPTITSATYNPSTGVMVVTGTNLVHKPGANNDIDISTLTVTGEAAGTYTITNASDVEITSDTQFSVTLSGADVLNINGLLNKNGTSSDDATTYNLSAADNWAAGAAASVDIADGSNAITVSGVVAPVVTSATYDGSTGVLTVTGSNFSSKIGSANDIDISKFTLFGEGDVDISLSKSADVEISSTSSFSITLVSNDRAFADGLFNKNGTVSDSSATTYNLAVADDWLRGAASTSDIADSTTPVTVSNVTQPVITAVSYDGLTGQLFVVGTNFRHIKGINDDVVTSRFTITGQGGSTYTLTSNSGDIGAPTIFFVTLNATDQQGLKALFTKTGTNAADGTLYNLSAADDWMLAATPSVDTSIATAPLTVTDIGSPALTLSASPSSISEAGGSTTLTATLTRAPSSNAVVTVGLSYSGTATNVADYNQSASITIPSGATTGSTTVTSVQDNEIEVDETIIVDVTSISETEIVEDGVQQQTITIVDDDSALVTLSVNNSSIAETGGSSVVTATLDKATYENVVVNLGYSGTATSGTDYATPASSITITAGQTSASTTLTASSDNIIETNETIVVDITGVTGGKAAESGTQQQTITISDDDSATVSLAVSNASIAEAGGTSTVTATLSQSTYEAVVVSLGYSGTATSGSDYATPVGSITIAAGQTSGSATLTAINDTLVEDSETIVVDITGVTGGKVTENGVQQQIVTITDDDSPVVTLAVNNTSMPETGGTSTITASLDKATFENVVVSLGYSGTATSGTDYATPASSITIAAGQTSGSTTLTATSDTTVEVDETIIVDITGVAGGKATESGTQQQTVTITDDDNALVTLSASTNSMNENGGTSTITASLASVTYEPVLVTLSYSGTATSGVDYTTPPGSLTIPTGQTSSSLTLTSIDDATEEANESIIVDIASVSGGSALEDGVQQQTVSIVNDDDQSAPSGYSANFNGGGINSASANNMSFTVNNAEVGTTYDYSVTDNQGNLAPAPNSSVRRQAKNIEGDVPIIASATSTGTGVITSNSHLVDGIDVTSLADGEITLTVTLTDSFGNVGASHTSRIEKDATVPVATLSALVTSPINGPFDLSVTFNESVNGLALEDFTVVNAQLSALTGSADSYSVTVTPTTTGDVTVTLNAEAVQDALGNDNDLSDTFTTSHDNTQPLLVALSPDNNATNVTPSPTMSLTLTENVIAGSSDNLIEVKAVADDSVIFAVAASDSSVTINGSTVSFDVTAALIGGQSYYVDVGAGAFVDAAGNAFDGISGSTNWRFAVTSNLPNAIADTATVDEDNVVAIDVLANDSGIDANLNPASVSVTGEPQNGSTSVNTATGVITYTPSENFNGNDSFNYTVRDLNGTASEATSVTITVNSVNDAPVAVDDVSSIAEDATVVIDVIANDTDVDGAGQFDSTSLNIVSAATNGDATVVEGKVNYVAKANFNGTDSFTYTVADLAGLTSNVATVTVNISSTNDAPTTVADTATTNEETAVTIAVLSNDNDVDGQINTASVAISANADNGTAEAQSDGTVVYTPALNFFGTDSFTYTVRDELDSISQSTVVTVTVANVNDAPVANDDTVIVQEDVPHEINLTGNDNDIDGTISSLEIISNPQNGQLSQNGLVVIYTPGGNFSGVDSFNYQLTDDTGATSNVASVSLTIEAVNDAPIANNDSAQVNEEGSVEIDVLANDSDIDGQLNPQSLSIVSQGAGGTAEVVSNGIIRYSPAFNFIGEDSFVYQISDNGGASSNATVTIQVINSNDAPVAADMSLFGNEDVSFSFVLEGSDPDGDTLIYTINSNPQNGSLSGQAPNLTYQPGTEFSGSDSFTYSVSDGVLQSSIATVSISISAVNDAPVADSQTVQGTEDTAVDIVLTGSDLEGALLNFNVVSQPLNGVLTGNAPNLVYTPGNNFNGTDSFTFNVDDGELTSGNATVSINVAAQNDLPVANPITLNLQEDSSASFTLSGSDLDGDGLTFNILSAPANGQINGQSPSFIYTPDGDFNGSDSFTFEANDGIAGSVPVTVEISVTAVNDAPVAQDDQVNRDNWLAFDVDVLANDSDIDGDALRILGATVDTGSLSFTNTAITYTPVDGFIGSAVINYRISDNNGGTDSARAVIDINVSDADLPVITVPPEVEVNANALSTKVDLGVATAVDRLGNPIPVSLDGASTFFKPGVHTVFWRATDSESRSAVASQLVKVHPLVSIDKDQTILEGFAVSVAVHLNGYSPVYPLEIPFTVSGTATVDVDHDLQDGSIIIESGTEGTIQFNVFSDTVFEGEETIVIDLASTLNRGAKFSHTVTINEQNVNPQVDLIVEQAGEERFIVNLEDGNVIVKSAIEHPDANNQYNYAWTNRQGLLTDIDDQEATFTFDPTGLDVGVYHVTLEVVDSDDTGFTGRKQVTIKLEQNTVALTEEDTDQDGVPDNVEGLGDADSDGIPDYLDAISECNVIPESVESSENYLLEGDPGVCMRLGDSALGGQSGGAGVSSGEVAEDTDAANIGGLYDFIAYGLPVAGQSYRVVLPQTQPIPVNAIYRKQNSQGAWQNFVETETEQLWSSAGEAGYCPPPGDERWEPGLIEGYWCVQLVIADGGPNDADGLANATIVDPGGVAVVLDNNTLPVAGDDAVETRLNTALIVDVLANDSDADGDHLSISSANATFGSVDIQNNQLFYQPALDYFGIDTIVYGISDGQGGSSSATLTVTVIANNNPVTVADSAEVASGQMVNIDVLANDSDVDGDQIRVIEAFADNGSVTIGSDNILTYQSNAGFSGSDTIHYRIEDALGGEAIGTVSVTVIAPPSEVNNRSNGGGTLSFLLLVYLCMVGYCRYSNYPIHIKRLNDKGG